MEQTLAGRTFGSRFDVLELLGAGGMGAVYRARDRELDELVALKVIRADRASPAMVELFRHEVKLARRVTHVNVARMFELGFVDGVMYCTMELVEGESLRARLQRVRVMSIAEAAAIAGALCNGLDAAHSAGVIHRDIKPENILLSTGGRVVLADFGVAAITTADADGSLSGTLEYMAPEQARGETATPASDIYAIGIVLFEMLTGIRVFGGTMTELIVAKQDMRPDMARVPGELRDIVARATAFDPAERHASARELGATLAPFAAPHVARDVPHEPRKELATVIVLAPRGDVATLHLAEGVHHELLRRLARLPHLRVWPRIERVDQANTTTISLHNGKALAVSIERGGHVHTLDLPLDVAQLELAAAAIVGTLGDLATTAPPTLELLLRARTLAHHGFSNVPEAIALLREAHALDPTEPTVAAELASLLMRNHFFSKDVDDAFTLGPELARQALVAAPRAAESHVAAAHVALHLGDPLDAAVEFRTAIACSPYLAEPHEGLGRMLLEAGFLDDALARIDDALAIAPTLNAVRWEVARAYALQGDWASHDALVDELRVQNDRMVARLRYALWRGDRALIHRIREDIRAMPYEGEFFARSLSAVVDNGWAKLREYVLQLARDGHSPSQRGNAFLSQVGAEVAALSGDHEGCLTLLGAAVGFGTFDRHWFERVPSLAAVRGRPEFARLHKIVVERAHAIHDALFFDLDAYRDTVFSS